MALERHAESKVVERFPPCPTPHPTETLLLRSIFTLNSRQAHFHREYAAESGFPSSHSRRITRNPAHSYTNHTNAQLLASCQKTR